MAAYCWVSCHGATGQKLERSHTSVHAVDAASVGECCTQMFFQCYLMHTTLQQYPGWQADPVSHMHTYQGRDGTCLHGLPVAPASASPGSLGTWHRKLEENGAQASLSVLPCIHEGASGCQKPASWCFASLSCIDHQCTEHVFTSTLNTCSTYTLCIVPGPCFTMLALGPSPA